jgi:1-phosphofructokinase family hexose kinase
VLVVAALTPSLDLTYLVESLRLGAIHRTADVVRCAGGKALNMARAATTVGADTEVVAVLGGATGDVLAAMLAEEGLPVTAVASPAETRTCVSIASREPSELTEVYQEAEAVPDDVWSAFCSALERVGAETSGWLSISGRAPVGMVDGIAEIVRLGHRHGLQVAVDSHGPALPAAVAAQPDLIKVNRLEAAELLGVVEGTFPADDMALAELARSIHRLTGRRVVLTDGAAGSVAVDATAALRVAAPETVGRFPVGSGDAFLGGLLTALDRGDDLAGALRLASACGAANAQVPGPGRLDVATVHRLQQRVRLAPV